MNKTYYPYPLQFAPILKEMIWGGTLLRDLLGKQTTSNKVGESWELSGLPNNVSIVSNGEYAGMTLDEVIALAPEEILGKRVVRTYGTKFPLLIKFIDACADLSVQVHPNDEQARPLGSAGKTEMWYVLQAQPDATLIAGLNQPLTEDEYLRRTADGSIIDVLQKHNVAAGDAFFIPAGRVHAIGRGILLLEIQQASDITYRIYDYNRRDAQGNPRQLHTEEARRVINYNDCLITKCRLHKQTGNAAPIHGCDYFNVNVIAIDKMSTSTSMSVVRNYMQDAAFVVLICTKGEVAVQYHDNKSVAMKAGETTLIPAAISSITLTPRADAEIVEVKG
jgi:mannose-6-phosphate isomerase